MEEVACAVGGGFVDNHGHWLQQYSGTGGTQYVFGSLAEGLAPDSHFGAVHQAVVSPTTGIWTFGGADFYLAVARSDAKHGAALPHPFHKFSATRCRFSFVGEQFRGITPDHAVEHIFYLLASDTLLGDDQRIEAFTMDELQPRHV